MTPQVAAILALEQKPVGKWNIPETMEFIRNAFNIIRQQQAEIERLQTLADFMRGQRDDARRYRWLREHRFGTQVAIGDPYQNEADGRSVEMSVLSGTDLDAAIDAAITQQTQGESRE